MRVGEGRGERAALAFKWPRGCSGFGLRHGRRDFDVCAFRAGKRLEEGERAARSGPLVSSAGARATDERGSTDSWARGQRERVERASTQACEGRDGSKGRLGRGSEPLSLFLLFLNSILLFLFYLSFGCERKIELTISYNFFGG